MTTPSSSLNLDDGRAERARARAAAQEGRAETIAVVLGGRQVAVLGAEFPLSVLAPLADVDVDIAYVIKAVTQAAQATERQQQQAGLDLLVNVLAASPSLPASLLAAIREIGRRILGDEGYAALVAWEPTPQDIAALAKGLASWYGLSLGELTGSSPLPAGSDGETSKPTSSSTTTDSTPAAPGEIPAPPAIPESPAAPLLPASSEPAVS